MRGQIVVPVLLKKGASKINGLPAPENCEDSMFVNACFHTDASGWLDNISVTWNANGSADLITNDGLASAFYQNFTLDDGAQYGLSLTGGHSDLFWLVNDVLTATPTTDTFYFEGTGLPVSIGMGTSGGAAVSANVDSVLLWNTDA